MHEPTYTKALKASWDLTWRHKTLWVFGLSAALVGQLGLMDLLAKIGLATRASTTILFWIGLPRAFVHTVRGTGGHLSPEQWGLVLWSIVIIVAIFAFLAFIATVSQGALVHASAQSFKLTRGVPNLGASWHVGVGHFWRLFFLNLIKKIIFGLIALLIACLSLRALYDFNVWDRLSFVVMFLLAVFAGMVLSFLLIYTAGYIVVENYSLPEAIVSAWKLFLDHAVVSLEVGVIVLCLNILVAIACVLAMYVFFLPSLIAGLIAFVVNSQLLFVLGLLVGVLLFLVFIILLGAMFSTFTTSLWTYLFMKMHRQGITSRMLHWLK